MSTVHQNSCIHYVFLFFLRAHLTNYLGRGGQSSLSPGSGNVAVTPPTSALHVSSTDKVQSSFSLGGESSKSGGRGNHTPSDTEQGGGHLEEFIDQQKISPNKQTTEGQTQGQSDSGGVSLKNRPQENAGPEPCPDNDRARLRGSEESGSPANPDSRDRISEDSPVEPAYLDGYGGDDFLRRDREQKGSSDTSHEPTSGRKEVGKRQTHIPVVTQRLSSGFDDTLGPWKPEGPRSLNPFDGQREIDGDSGSHSLGNSDRVTEEQAGQWRLRLSLYLQVSVLCTCVYGIHHVHACA